MADDIKLPEPVAWRYVPSAVWRGYAYTDLQAMAAEAEALGCNPEPLYTADQLRAVISAALASRPYKLPPMPAVFQHMPPLPPPFRAGGQQIADDGNDKVFCDLWERGQVEAHARAAVEADRAQRKPLTDEQIDGLHGEANRGYCIERDDYFKAFRDAERAHGIPAPKGGSDAQA